jgi:hypothetical protein
MGDMKKPYFIIIFQVQETKYMLSITKLGIQKRK